MEFQVHHGMYRHIMREIFVYFSEQTTQIQAHVFSYWHASHIQTKFREEFLFPVIVFTLRFGIRLTLL